MADLIIKKSDLMKDLDKGRRIRTQDYHGSLKATCIGPVSTSEFSFTQTTDTLILCPMGISAKLYLIVNSLSVANETGKGDSILNLYWRNEDGSYEQCGEIGNFTEQKQTTATHVRYMVSPKVLWEFVDKNKYLNWKDHRKDKYLYLGIKVKTANETNDPVLTYTCFFYVDGAPSDTPFEENSVGWKGDK